MRLLDLPDELLSLCCSQIERVILPFDRFDENPGPTVNVEALQKLRLTCKRILPIATKQLFSHLHLFPTKSSAQKVRAVLDDERLNPFVNTISIQTFVVDGLDEEEPHPCWHCHDGEDPDWDTTPVEDDEEHAIDIDGEPSATFKRTMDAFGLFRNLRRIELNYHADVEGPTADAEGRGGSGAIESMEYRDGLFRKLLRALNHPKHPASKLNSLSIMNLQDCVNTEVATSSDFRAVLARLESLELYIVSEDYEAAPEYEITILERHDFYSGELRKYWLQPLQEFGRLTSLKIYGSIPWGYLPKCDLRGLHFPKLRSLSLGNMNFTHDWQLEWIVSHGSTLESLSLRNCPIIPDTELIHEVDEENYPILPRVRQPTGRGRGVKSTWTYATRWHHYFNRFRSELPRLRHFTITNGHWLFSVDRRGDELEDWPDDPSRIFAIADAWPAKLYFSRYCMMTGYDYSRNKVLDIH